MSSERIEKFQTDCEYLLRIKNIPKIVVEIRKLCTWIQKHQNGIVPDSHKQILLSIIESYVQLLLKEQNNLLIDIIINLVDDYLKLPEGKLVNSKGKKKALKWLEILAGIQNNSDTENLNVQSPIRYLVIDMDQESKKLTVVNEKDQDIILDNISLQIEVFNEIYQQFENQQDVYVELSEGQSMVIKILN
jgi:hypothetical protein